MVHKTYERRLFVQLRVVGVACGADLVAQRPCTSSIKGSLQLIQIDLKVAALHRGVLLYKRTKSGSLI